MLIDWFTVIAQLINFLLLVWLLKHFLYGPILKTIDEREKRIADELADADSKKAEAELQCDEFQAKNTEFDKQRSANMEKVSEDAKTESKRLLDAVRQESDALRSKLELSLKNEQLSLQHSLSKRAKEEVFAIVNKVLRDLAGTDLEARMAVVFVKQLNELSDDEKASFELAFDGLNEPLMVHSAFDLSKKQVSLIKNALNKLLGEDLEVQFSTDPDVTSGIEINAHGQKIGWSLADYLTTLIKRVNEVMQSHDSEQKNSEQDSREQEKHKNNQNIDTDKAQEQVS
tara:strand:+ start:59881 stop:60738 length:858 start_codon:yes stop_codon:yes gene_type:complete